MRKTFLPLLLLCFIISCGPKAPSVKEVMLVNDQLVNKISKCSNAEKILFDVCLTYDSIRIKNELKQFVETCKKVKGQVEALDVHKDLDRLKGSTLQLVEEYVSLEPQYTEYARLYSIPESNYTGEDDKLTNEVAEKINSRIDAEYKEFKLVQEEFGNKYNYSIEVRKESIEK